MITQTRNELIIAMYKHRKSLRAVAKVFNISHERVRQILKEYGEVKMDQTKPVDNRLDSFMDLK